MRIQLEKHGHPDWQADMRTGESTKLDMHLSPKNLIYLADVELTIEQITYQTVLYRILKPWLSR